MKVKTLLFLQHFGSISQSFVKNKKIICPLNNVDYLAVSLRWMGKGL
jgi:hypothetical protein